MRHSLTAARLSPRRLRLPWLRTLTGDVECDDVTAETAVEAAAVDVEEEGKWMSARGAELKVGAETDAGSLGKVMEMRLRDAGKCEVRASGENAVMRFVRGAAFARKLILNNDQGDVHFQANHSFWSSPLRPRYFLLDANFRMDRNWPQQMAFCVQRSEAPLQVDRKTMNLIRVRRDTDMRQLGKSIRVALQRCGAVDVLAIGMEAVARSVVASTWARRLALAQRRDLDCYASLHRPPRALPDSQINVVSLKMVERDAPGDLRDAKMLSALRPPAFFPPVEQLESPEKTFLESVDVCLPIVKIRGETQSNKAAATFVSFLSSCGGLQVFSSGSAANNQALKAIAVCRQYIREIPGYDLALQCIHAPRDNRNGECQVVTWLRLMADASKRLDELEDDKVVFKVGNTNDAKSVGDAMATHLERSRRLDCVSLGIQAGARSLVALAHARLFLAQKRLDLVALPFFDTGLGVFDNQPKECVRLRFDVLCIEKK